MVVQYFYSLSSSPGQWEVSIMVFYWLKAWMATRIFFFVNPFTAPACQISRLKSMHIHSCEQYTWLSYNKSTFNTVHFACLRDGGVGGCSSSALLLVIFRVTVLQQAWQWKDNRQHTLSDCAILLWEQFILCCLFTVSPLVNQKHQETWSTGRCLPERQQQ